MFISFIRCDRRHASGFVVQSVAVKVLKRGKNSPKSSLFTGVVLLHMQSKLITLYKRKRAFIVVWCQVSRCSDDSEMGTFSSCALNTSVHRRSVSFSADPTGKPSKHINSVLVL